MPFIFHRLCQSTIYDSSKSFLPKADFAKQKMRYELTMETLSLTQADFRVTHLPGRPYPTPLKYPQYHRSLPRVLYHSEEGKAGSELRCRLCYRFELELDFFLKRLGHWGWVDERVECSHRKYLLINHLVICRKIKITRPKVYLFPNTIFHSFCHF